MKKYGALKGEEPSQNTSPIQVGLLAAQDSKPLSMEFGQSTANDSALHNLFGREFSRALSPASLNHSRRLSRLLKTSVSPPGIFTGSCMEEH